METSKIFEANRTSTNRMRQIIDRMSPSDLLTVLPNGWTVADTLGHLAFWDYRVMRVIELARENHKVDSPDLDIQLNEVLLPFLKAIPPAKISAMALEMAADLDEMLESCNEQLLALIDAENHRWVDRSLHRNEHLDDIENFLTN